ncbi:MAG: hypothetical protein D6737_06175 [Chloroflexi bacterium]|nr:MAG: hypothetical protein D6737_06175 [Chloroflexota bacterium]
METIRLKTHIGQDGVLRLEMPINARDVDCEVVVVYTVQDAEKTDWEIFVNTTYGSLADDPIECGEQPPVEIRDAIE